MMTEKKTTDADEAVEAIGDKAVKGDVGPGVATDEENAKLEHTEGGSTTRDDAHDMGVPMLPGSPDEPVGPEDALGEGPTRGDYRDRIGPDSYHPHESRPARDEDGEGVGSVMEAQRPRAEEIGDVAGKKGGVETAAGEETA
jgi:hypothetical protein